MKKEITFAEQYEIDRPLREAACQKYYENKLKTQDIEEAKKQKKYGNWLCSVITPMGYKFYTRTEFKEKWVKTGDVLGMWNELTLIEKTGKENKKVILELYMEIWYCYEEGKSMAYPLFTNTSYDDAEALCKKRKYEVVQVIDLELQEIDN